MTQERRSKLVIPFRASVFMKEFEEIIALRADGNYTYILMENGEKILSAKTLRFYADQLDDRFFRIHRSHLINTDFIQRVDMKKRSVIMKNKSEMPISRSKKTPLLKYCLLKLSNKNDD